MDAFLHTCIAGVNDLGRGFWSHAAGVFLQSGILIAVLLSIDLLLRDRLRATVRYWIWMLVFIKLILPPSLSLPTGVGYWMGRYIPISMLVLPQVPEAPVIPTAFPESLTTELWAIGEAGADVTTTPGERLTWQGGILLLWSVGVLVFAGLVIQRLRFVKGLIARAEPAEGDLPQVLDQCRRRMGVRRQVEMRLSPHLFSPAVCGLWRPTILMPAALPAELPPEKLRTVLIHELAHVRRADLWINCLQAALQIVYFYNPLIWLANASVRRVREQAVDEMVLVALGAEAGSYSRTLIDIAEMAFLRASSALGLVGVAESKKSLEGRIRRMLNRPIPKSARVGVAGVLVVAALGALLLPMAAADIRTPAAELAAVLPGGGTQAASQLPPGIAELFGLSKDDLLAKYGQPSTIFYGQNQYTLDNLPQRYFMVFGEQGLSFHMGADRVGGITLLGPAYVFGNGVRVGDSEAKVKEAFGPDYVVKESPIKDFLIYEQFDLSFEVYKPDRIVREINIGGSYGRAGRAGQKAAGGTGEGPRIYQVDRRVADFPPAADMSTPEAAYATINRMPRNDPSAWQKVSTAALAERMARAGAKREAAVDTEWAKILANARILQVIVWNNTRAAVLAELPQALSSKKIVAPIDVRYLERENGRWLNTGNDRFWTVEEAKAKFTASMEKAGGGQPGLPGLPQGIAELFGLSKEDLLARFGQPGAIFYGENRYSLDDLPEQYYMSFGDRGLSFHIRDNRIVGVTLLGPAYVFSNGVRVGDSEAKVKQAFGSNYVVKESQSKDFLIYPQLDLSFEVYKPDRIVREINIGRDYGRPNHSEGQKVDRDNLSAIGKAYLLYANDHEDKLPPDLQTLVQEANLSPAALESQRKPKDFHGPSHIYIPGQSLSMYPGNIVAYENPEFSAGGTNVLFLDSHVEFMKAEAFREELRTTYERLGKPMPETKFQDEVKPRPPQSPRPGR